MRDPRSNRCTMSSEDPVRHFRDVPSAPITRFPTDSPLPSPENPKGLSDGIDFNLGKISYF